MFNKETKQNVQQQLESWQEATKKNHIFDKFY